MLTEEQIDKYNRDGFLAPVTVMTPDEAGRYRTLLEKAESRWPDELQGGNRNNAHLVFPFLDELCHHPGIVNAVRCLLGDDLLICGSVLFLKEARTDEFVSFHQDATYMGLDPQDGVSAWLALTPSNTENGCMRMVPGTHRKPIREHVDTADNANILTRGQTVTDVDTSMAVDLVLEPGQMSLHHVKTLHDSTPNHSDDRRIGFVVQSFVRPGVRQNKGTMHVQLASGRDDHKAHPYAPRARGSDDFNQDGVQIRDHVNEQWLDILYDGTSRQRRF